MALITNKSYVDKDVMLYGTGTYDTTTTPSNQVKIKASDGATSDQFGYSVAIGSGRIVVGAYADNIGSNTDQGSAYIFNLSGTQLAKIVASDGASLDYFGSSVAVGCGRIVVGAFGDNDINASWPGPGSAYIFNLNGTQLTKIKASDGALEDYFGASVAIGCGRIVVGAKQDGDLGTNSGSVYIFDLNGNQLAKIKASDGAAGDQFGYSVAVGSGRIVVGAKVDDGLGSVYIFDLNGTQLAKIVASDGTTGDQFGYSVAVGSGRIVVGAPDDNPSGSQSGSAYVFNLSGTQLAKIVASDGVVGDVYGRAIAIGSGRIIISALGNDDLGSLAGAAYIYTTPNQPHILDILDNK
jgi:hypothetical protein